MRQLSLHALAAMLALAVRRARRRGAAGAAPFPAGKPVTMHVGVAPGGGNDHVMRMVARHIGKYLPGNPNVVREATRRAPAAGGSRACIANTAPRDGTELAQLHRGLVIEQLLGEVTLPFKLQDLTWLGSPTSTTDTCIVWHTARVQSVEDLKTHELVVAGSGNEAAAAPPAATPDRRQGPQRDRLSRRRRR